MIVPVDSLNISEAAALHSASWQASHRSFCDAEFVLRHTPERQREYISKKIDAGSRFYLLVEDEPVGIVSVTGSVIADLYVLPERQGMGYGTKLLQFAVEKCTGTPTLWILENNVRAKRLYEPSEYIVRAVFGILNSKRYPVSAAIRVLWIEESVKFCSSVRPAESAFM